ncbi:MAG: C1 family peptidase [Lewinellaceae bacterium]|nr:C1 family peptidase [Lewinellaceae bacterium]
MQKALILVTVFLITRMFSPVSAPPQNGVILGEVMFDSVAYHNIPLEDTFLLKAPGEYCPLKLWSPKVIDQAPFAICVSTAITNAYTIMRARDCGLIGVEKVRQVQHSLCFLHKHIVKTIDGVTGAFFEDGFNFIRDKGICLEKSFEFRKALNRQPGPTELDEASKYKIASYKRLFNTNSSPKLKVSQTQSMLMDCIPVVVGIWTTPDFRNFRGHLWRPQAPPRTGKLHAVVVAGYNEATGEFELINSYGENWGNKGYFYMEEEDFGRYVLTGFYMSLGEFTPPCND